MGPREFWVELFRNRATDEPELTRSADAAFVLAAAHRDQYGNYLGPSQLSRNDQGCIWTFARCEHGEKPGPCEAHQGFLRGTLEGLGFVNVSVERDWRKSICNLGVQWEKP